MTVERLNQYINSRLNRLQEEFDIALESCTGNPIPTSRWINRVAVDAEHDIYSVLFEMPDDVQSILEINSLVLKYQKIVGEMRIEVIDILIDKNGGLR